MALRVSDRVDESGVQRKRLPDVLVVDEVRPAYLVNEGSGRHRVGADEEGRGPSDVQHEDREQGSAPGETAPDGRDHVADVRRLAK